MEVIIFYRFDKEIFIMIFFFYFLKMKSSGNEGLKNMDSTPFFMLSVIIK